ncbi:MFS transporter [Desulfofalx alkaliphila]|uniref:MFS transporter n=1 Tax=Desulfofalx alkaliphila TaxID=105483 RepID=UPI0004E20C47|nr:MFS transporter [Desulfofalx alkaliphila]
MDYRTKTLIVVALTIFMDTFIYGIIVPVLPIYVEEMGASSFELGIIFSIYSAMLLLVAIPLGILSDKYGRKGIMVVGMIALSFSTVAFAYSTTYLALLLTRLLQGAAAAATWTIGPALIADLYPPEKRGEKLGLTMAGMNFGFFIGPVAGGFLYDWGGYALPFLVSALMSLVILMLVVVVIKEPEQRETERTGLTLQEVFSNRAILTGAGLIFVASIGFGFIDPLLPGYFNEKFGATPGTIGLLFGAISATSIVAQPSFGWLSDRIGRIPPIIAGLMATAIAMPLITAAPSILHTMPVMAAVGITYGMIFAPSGPLLADAVMKGKQNASYGMAFGIYNTAFSLGYLIGPLLGGLWVDIWDLRSLLLAYSVLLVTYVPVMLAGRKTGVRESG